MGTKRIVVNFTEQEIADYVERRIFMPALASKYGVTKDTIASRLRDLNRDDVNATISANNKAATVRLSASTIDAIIFDYNSGVKMTDIEFKYGISVPTINKYLKENGVKSRVKPERSVKVNTATRKTADDIYVPKTRFTIPHLMLTKSMGLSCSA